jgi:membrane carboxypeptidase/penicillin-binding protein
VAAAARRYFDKQVSELDLAEMATIAGIAQAPSRYSPILAPDLTRARRDQVLSAMAVAGVIDEATANNLRARPLAVRQPPDFFRERSPYFAEHVRRDIAKRFGEKSLWEGGLEIETTLVPWIDESAQENVDFSLRKLDKRQGWRGPVAHLVGAAAAEFRQRAQGSLRGHAAGGRAALPRSRRKHARGQSPGARRREDLSCCRRRGWNGRTPYSTVDSTNGRTLTSTKGVLHPATWSG